MALPPAARSIAEVVRIAVILPRNARALIDALHLGGGVKGLSPGEIERRMAARSDGAGILPRLGILGDPRRLRPDAGQARDAPAQPQPSPRPSARRPAKRRDAR